MDWEKYRKWYKIEGCCGMQCHLDTVHGSPGSIVKRRMIWERTQWQWEDSLSFYDGVIFLTARLTILWMWTANRTKSLRRTWDAQTGRILRMVMKLGKWMARMVMVVDDDGDGDADADANGWQGWCWLIFTYNIFGFRWTFDIACAHLYYLMTSDSYSRWPPSYLLF